jgi:antitoxin component YwqK of YwqJK toxin-antitoxin module
MKPRVRTYYHTNGQKKSETYQLNGNLHNEIGPAIQSWTIDGKLEYEGYWLNGRRHNEIGPARRCWYETGQICFFEYWLNDKHVTKDALTALKIKNFLDDKH